MKKAVPAPQQGNLDEPVDVECPICYQEYNQYNKCPQMLECLHVFCAECLQLIQIRPSNPSDANSPKSIACPLCRHLTLLDTGGALSLPCNSRILSRLPPAAPHMSEGKTNRLSSVPQGMVFSLEGDSRDPGFIIVPTVSLRVQQMHPERPCGAAYLWCTSAICTVFLLSVLSYFFCLILLRWEFSSPPVLH
uniref:Si:ch73-335l21.2 n=1 Tax=Oryzias sinensis TaxID=183150 RepID=A0A8C7WRN7_9TELE